MTRNANRNTFRKLFNLLIFSLFLSSTTRFGWTSRKVQLWVLFLLRCGTHWDEEMTWVERERTVCIVSFLLRTGSQTKTDRNQILRQLRFNARAVVSAITVTLLKILSSWEDAISGGGNAQVRVLSPCSFFILKSSRNAAYRGELDQCYAVVLDGCNFLAIGW